MIIKPSPRLTFRLMTLDDGCLLHELDQNPKVMKYINGGKISSTEEIESVMLPRLAKYLNPDKGWGIWQVSLTSTQQYIGWVLIRPMDFFSDKPQWENLEIGWRFKEEAWGKGYATEAAKHLVTYLTKSMDVERFSAIALPDNQASIGVMEKLGMSYIKTYLHQDPLGDAEVVLYEVKKLNNN